jgi:hypothetical protein
MSAAIDFEHVEALKRSFELVGPIYPIIENQNGKEVSGRHRSLTGKPWPRKRVNFENKFQEELYNLMSNTHRQLSEEETKFRLNRVAMEYWILNKCKEETVCAELIKLLGPHDVTQPDGTTLHVPMWKSASWISRVLDDRWKGPQGPKKIEVTSISDDINAKVQKLKKVKTALDDLSTTLDGEPSYPYPECKCSTCEHKTECY